jgi:hypothetical protein
MPEGMGFLLIFHEPHANDRPFSSLTVGDLVVPVP